MLRLTCTAVFAAALFTLGGCTTGPLAPSAPKASAVSADQAGLKEGITLFENGQFTEAIKRLGAPDVTSASKATQVAALKYSAFSYCVSNRATQCRQQFEKAFKLDPAFELGPGEQGHPLWGPAFARAKKSSTPH